MFFDINFKGNNMVFMFYYCYTAGKKTERTRWFGKIITVKTKTDFCINLKITIALRRKIGYNINKQFK